MVAVAVAGDREGVDRVDLIAGGGQRLHPQAAVGFDADHDLTCLFGVAGYQFVQLPDAGQPLGEPPRCQPSPGLVHQMDIVMVFGPIISDEDHRSPPLVSYSGWNLFKPRGTRRQSDMYAGLSRTQGEAASRTVVVGAASVCPVDLGWWRACRFRRVVNSDMRGLGTAGRLFGWSGSLV